MSWNEFWVLVYNKQLWKQNKKVNTLWTICTPPPTYHSLICLSIYFLVCQAASAPFFCIYLCLSHKVPSYLCLAQSLTRFISVQKKQGGRAKESKQLDRGQTRDDGSHPGPLPSRPPSSCWVWLHCAKRQRAFLNDRMLGVFHDCVLTKQDYPQPTHSKIISTHA